MDCAIIVVTRTMAKRCCAVRCHNVCEKESGVKFHRFPSDVERISKWIAAVKRERPLQVIP